MTRTTLILSLACIMTLTSCKKCKDDGGGDAQPQEETHSLTLTFNGMFGDSVMAYNALKYITAANDTIAVSNLKYLLSEFKLQKQNGEFVSITDYGYISLATGTKSFTLKDIPKNDYKSIAFKVGLNPTINHGDPAQWGATHPLNPGVNGMHWGWSGGYIFNMFEGSYNNNGMPSGFTYHVARDTNVKSYNFAQAFTLSADMTASFNVQVDKYFSTPVVFSIKTDGAISHSGENDPTMDKFSENMVSIFNLESVK